MSAPTQQGTPLRIGIDDFKLVGYTSQGFNRNPTAEVKVVKDDLGATTTIITADKGRTISIDVIIPAATDPELVEVSDIVTVDAVKYRIVSVDWSGTPAEEQVATFELMKEDSITYV